MAIPAKIPPPEALAVLNKATFAKKDLVFYRRTRDSNSWWPAQITHYIIEHIPVRPSDVPNKYVYEYHLSYQLIGIGPSTNTSEDELPMGVVEERRFLNEPVEVDTCNLLHWHEFDHLANDASAAPPLLELFRRDLARGEAIRQQGSSSSSNAALTASPSSLTDFIIRGITPPAWRDGPRTNLRGTVEQHLIASKGAKPTVEERRGRFGGTSRDMSVEKIKKGKYEEPDLIVPNESAEEERRKFAQSHTKVWIGDRPPTIGAEIVQSHQASKKTTSTPEPEQGIKATLKNLFNRSAEKWLKTIETRGSGEAALEKSPKSPSLIGTTEPSTSSLKIKNKCYCDTIEASSDTSQTDASEQLVSTSALTVPESSANSQSTSPKKKKCPLCVIVETSTEFSLSESNELEAPASDLTVTESSIKSRFTSPKKEAATGSGDGGGKKSQISPITPLKFRDPSIVHIPVFSKFPDSSASGSNEPAVPVSGSTIPKSSASSSFSSPRKSISGSGRAVSEICPPTPLKKKRYSFSGIPSAVKSLASSFPRMARQSTSGSSSIIAEEPTKLDAPTEKTKFVQFGAKVEKLSASGSNEPAAPASGSTVPKSSATASFSSPRKSIPGSGRAVSEISPPTPLKKKRYSFSGIPTAVKSLTSSFPRSAGQSTSGSSSTVAEEPPKFDAPTEKTKRVQFGAEVEKLKQSVMQFHFVPDFCRKLLQPTLPPSADQQMVVDDSMNGHGRERPPVEVQDSDALKEEANGAGNKKADPAEGSGSTQPPLPSDQQIVVDDSMNGHGRERLPVEVQDTDVPKEKVNGAGYKKADPAEESDSTQPTLPSDQPMVADDSMNGHGRERSPVEVQDSDVSKEKANGAGCHSMEADPADGSHSSQPPLPSDLQMIVESGNGNDRERSPGEQKLDTAEEGKNGAGAGDHKMDCEIGESPSKKMKTRGKSASL